MINNKNLKLFAKLSKKSTAQGTVEYLVIIAVVIVLSLIVVGLFISVSSSPSQQISESSERLGASSRSGININEGVIDVQGESIIKLNNNSSDAITLTRITVGGIDNEFSEQLVGLDSKIFSLSDLISGCVCVANQKSVSCEYVINYTQNGLEKTDRITKTIECVVDAVPVNPPTVVGLGSGNLTDPWIINSCQELQGIKNHLDGNYKLGANIDCASSLEWNSEAGFEPIGKIGYCSSDPETYYSEEVCEGAGTCIHSECPDAGWWCTNRDSCENCVNWIGCSGENGVWGNYNYNWIDETPFTGSFNGDNKTISNLTINRPSISTVGLFGYSKGNIANVGLVDVNINGNILVGGLVAYLSDANVSNSFVTGNVEGYEYVGGLIAYQLGGLISKSYSLANVTGTSPIVNYGNDGGLVGLSTGIIDECYYIGTISAPYSGGVGGLVGTFYSNAIQISNSYSSANVTGQVSVGGLVGSNSSLILNSYSTGIVTGDSAVGSLVGSSGADVVVPYLISNSFSTASVFGNENVYGFVGSSYEPVFNSYWDTYLTGKSNCYRIGGYGVYNDSNVGCTPTYNLVTDYQGTSGVAKLGNVSNWKARDNNYPILSWQ